MKARGSLENIRFEVMKKSDKLYIKDYNSSCLPLSKTQILPSLYQFC